MTLPPLNEWFRWLTDDEWAQVGVWYQHNPPYRIADKCIQDYPGTYWQWIDPDDQERVCMTARLFDKREGELFLEAFMETINDAPHPFDLPSFLNRILKRLESERKIRPYHKDHYIDWRDF